MPLRRLLLILLLLLFATSMAASLTNRTTTSTTPSRRAPAQAGLARTVTATLPGDKVVRAAVGDRIVLAVAADAPDDVTIAGYDLLGAVDPETPAQFDFIADRTGRFAVTLESSGKVVGHLEVAVRP